MAFQVEHVDSGDTGVLRHSVLRISGELDSRSAADFEEELLGAVHKAENIVLDCGQLEYVSSSGLRVLVMVGRRLAAADGQLVLCDLNEQVLQVLDIAGLVRVFSIEPTVEKAIASLRQERGQDRLATLVMAVLERGGLPELTGEESPGVEPGDDQAVAAALRILRS